MSSGRPASSIRPSPNTALPGSGSAPAWGWDDKTEGFVQHRVHASYLHTHPAGRPEAVRRFGLQSTLLERDDDIPSLDELVAEAGHAADVAAEAHAG